ncbi:MAG: glycosyltransferase family 9 protein [Chloroflexota bacterium]
MARPGGNGASASLPEGGKVVILRALPGLGDTLTAIPAIRALKRNRPDVSVSVIAHESAMPFWRRYPQHVDRVIAFPGWPGLPERKPDIARVPGFLSMLQEERFDLAVQLQGDGRIVNQVVALLGARRTAGHYPPSEPSAPAGTWLPWRDGQSEIRRGLRLMATLGFPDDDESLEFEVARGVVTRDGIIRSLFPTIRHQEDRVPMALVHPGASAPARRWPIERFARVADGLAAQGYRIAITGVAAERPLAERLMQKMRCTATDLTGRTTLDELAEIVRRSAVVVCNDTGISHLAAALKVPSVVIFTDSEMARWAPLDGRLHKPVSGSAEQVLSQARRVARRASGDAAA